MIHLSIVHPQIHWIAGDKKHHHLSLLSDILALQATYLPPLEKKVANLDLYLQAEVNGCQLLTCNPVTMSDTNPLMAPVLYPGQEQKAILGQQHR